MTNFERLDAAITYAYENPDEFDMGDWFAYTSCGTTACIAGTAVQQAGWRPARTVRQTGTTYAKRDGIQRPVIDVATELFDLTNDQQMVFFASGITKVIQYRNRWAHAEGVPERSWGGQS